MTDALKAIVSRDPLFKAFYYCLIFNEKKCMVTAFKLVLLIVYINKNPKEKMP